MSVHFGRRVGKLVFMKALQPAVTKDSVASFLLKSYVNNYSHCGNCR